MAGFDFMKVILSTQESQIANIHEFTDSQTNFSIFLNSLTIDSPVHKHRLWNSMQRKHGSKKDSVSDLHYIYLKVHNTHTVLAIPLDRLVILRCLFLKCEQVEVDMH